MRNIFLLLLVSISACANGGAVANSAGGDPIAIDAIVTCDEDAEGYALAFRMRNLGGESISVPNELLPWSQAMLATSVQLVTEDGTVLTGGEKMASAWGRTVIAPGTAETGVLPLIFVFNQDELNTSLTAGDAELRWGHLFIDGDIRIESQGSAKLLGGAFYEQCQRGFPVPERRGAVIEGSVDDL